MKIAIVLDSLIRGGAERQALYATRELLKHGCDVELIYYNQTIEPHDTSFLPEGRVTYFPKNGQNYRFLFRLGGYFRRRAFQVVHGFLGGPSVYAGLAGRLARVPVVLTGVRAEYYARGVERMAHRIVNKLVCGWVVNSKATVPTLVRGVGADPSRVFVVYNGIDSTAFVSDLTSIEAKARLGLDARSRTVSIIGMLRAQKNHELFLKMAPLVRKAVPDARFLIVGGEGEVKPETLERLAVSLGVRECVHFLGIRSDIPDILAASEVVTLTSHYEGVANVLLEAMGVGIPVVTTRYAGSEELVTDGHDGFIVPMGDAPALADRVIRLLNDPPLRKSMGERGKETVAQRFSMDAMGRNMLSVYSNCLQSVPGAGDR